MAKKPEAPTQALQHLPKALQSEGRFLYPRRDFIPAYLKSYSELAAAMLRLQRAGCHNINFVTPEHVVPQILEALLVAIPGGLCVPLVYNTGAYVNLMDRYHPAHRVETEARFSGINRCLSHSEFQQAMDCATAAGLWRLDARHPVSW